MKRAKQLEEHLRRMNSISYENPNGGAYAYVQFLAHARELILFLRTVRGCDKEVEMLDATGWLFNEYLTVQFTHRHKVIFETKMLELKESFEFLRERVRETETSTMVGEPLHAQAA